MEKSEWQGEGDSPNTPAVWPYTPQAHGLRIFAASPYSLATSQRSSANRMMNDYNKIPLINDKSSRQFEMEVEGRTAKVEYELNGTKMFLTHSNIPKSLIGKGVGAALVEKVFAYIEENNLKLVPMCAHVTAHLREHPEWKRIVEKGVEV